MSRFFFAHGSMPGPIIVSMTLITPLHDPFLYSSTKQMYNQDTIYRYSTGGTYDFQSNARCNQ
jgi:hypothetical protein